MIFQIFIEVWSKVHSLLSEKEVMLGYQTNKQK